MLSLVPLLSVEAAQPPDSFKTALQHHAVDVVLQKNKEQGLSAALAHGDAFRENVTDGPEIQYELALMLNRAGELNAAIERYTALLEGNPKHIPSLYDRGEILLLQGRFESAEFDLRQLVDLKPDVWVVHFRLAEVAAYQSDASAFEQQILEALRDGFSLSMLAESGEHWHNWANDPSLGLVLKQLFLLYGSESQWLQLQQ